MIGEVASLLNQAAMLVGYLVLGLIGLYVGLQVLSYYLWRESSQGAKEVGAAVANETDVDSGLSAMVANALIDEIDEIAPDTHLEYEPRPVAQLDWSIDSPPSTETNVIVNALEDAGYYVHPFPQERDGDWSRAYVGIWKREPDWYLERKSEDGEVERVSVTPDTERVSGFPCDNPG